MFQLDDSKSFYRKWWFHQTTIYKWLFRVPGMGHGFLHPKTAHPPIFDATKKCKPLVGGNSKVCLFSPPNPGEDRKIPNLTNIFQMGWFNHQLVPPLFVFSLVKYSVIPTWLMMISKFLANKSFESKGWTPEKFKWNIVHQLPWKATAIFGFHLRVFCFRGIRA